LESNSIPDFFNILKAEGHSLESRITFWSHSHIIKKTFSAELLNTADQLKDRYNKTILIELGFPISEEGPKYKYEFSYGKIFEYDAQSIQTFISSTQKLAEFRKSYSDENYTIYELIK
jgi:hypothetical protein